MTWWFCWCAFIPAQPKQSESPWLSRYHHLSYVTSQQHPGNMTFICPCLLFSFIWAHGQCGCRRYACPPVKPRLPWKTTYMGLTAHQIKFLYPNYQITNLSQWTLQSVQRWHKENVRGQRKWNMGFWSRNDISQVALQPPSLLLRLLSFVFSQW